MIQSNGKSSEVISFALAGYGRFGRHHANVLSNHPSAQVSAIAEPDPLQSSKLVKIFLRLKFLKILSG